MLKGAAKPGARRAGPAQRTCITDVRHHQGGSLGQHIRRPLQACSIAVDHGHTPCQALRGSGTSGSGCQRRIQLRSRHTVSSGLGCQQCQFPRTSANVQDVGRQACTTAGTMLLASISSRLC